MREDNRQNTANKTFLKKTAKRGERSKEEKIREVKSMNGNAAEKWIGEKKRRGGERKRKRRR